METEIFKVEISINALDKYTKLIQEKGYSYIIYNYDNNSLKVKIIEKFQRNK